VHGKWADSVGIIRIFEQRLTLSVSKNEAFTQTRRLPRGVAKVRTTA
jgi:hypothetical protein